MDLGAGRTIVFAIVGFMVIAGIFGFWCYQQGKDSVYADLNNTPVKSDTVLVHDTITLPPIKIKGVKADTVYQIPDSVKKAISIMTGNIDSLKAKLEEVANPWGLEIDSARYYMYIYSDPWTKMNNVTLNIKPIPYTYPLINTSQTLLRDDPWYYDVLKIGGGVLVGYGLSRIK